MLVALSGHEAPAVGIELAVFLPLRSHLICQVADDPESIPVLHHTEVAVYRGKKVVEHPGRSEAVPFPDTLLAVPHNPVADIDAVALEPGTDELPAQGNILLVALRRVHLIPILLEQLLFAQSHVGEACFQVIHNPPHIVHKTAVAHSAGIYLPMVKVIEVVVFLYLPELICEAGTATVLAVEDDGLPGLDNRLPFVPRGDQHHVIGRERVIHPHKDIQQVVTFLTLRETLLDKFSIMGVAPVQITRREISLDVPGYEPAIPSEVVGHLPDVLHQPLDGFVWSVAHTIIEGTVGQSLLDHRPHEPVKMELHHLAGHQAGYDLTRPWSWRNESIKKGGKGAVVHILQEPRQVSLPVQLKHHRVRALLLVRSAVQVISMKCF